MLPCLIPTTGTAGGIVWNARKKFKRLTQRTIFLGLTSIDQDSQIDLLISLAPRVSFGYNHIQEGRITKMSRTKSTATIKYETLKARIQANLLTDPR